MSNEAAIRDRVEDRFNRFDQRQQQAVNAILDEWSEAGNNAFVLPVVDGPPGTGKTSVGTLAVAHQLLENRETRIAYLCYTHFAADVAQESLRRFGFDARRIVRLTSNPLDMDTRRGVLGCSYDPWTNSYMDGLSDNSRRYLQQVQLLLCTLHGSGRAMEALSGSQDVRIIVDEFSQVSPPIFFATMQKVRKQSLNPSGYALLGDPLQLPVVTTQPLLQPNIADYIRRLRPNYRAHELELQFRMHDEICQAINSLRRALNAGFYLRTGPTVMNRDLTSDSENLGFEWRRSETDDWMNEILDPSHPLVIVDTSNLRQEEVAPGGSKRNSEEAGLAARIAIGFSRHFRNREGTHLVPMILTPYAGQVREIRNALPPDLQESCATIYSAQGREYPCVIISFVWNNPSGFVGFLEDFRLRAQTYVACSRAQAKLVVLMSKRCFVDVGGHVDFIALYNTPTAHHVEARS
jgi:hypothetical protein